MILKFNACTLPLNKPCFNKIRVMPNQNIFIAHPTSDEQVKAAKAFFKALNIKFEKAVPEKNYNKQFVTKIERARKDYKDGNGKVITIDQLNSLWK